MFSRAGIFLSVLAMTGVSLAQSQVRSTLYPANWSPGYADADGHFLHDFSYAGYHKSEINLPTIAGPITDVTKPPYSADASGSTDATLAIQRALDDVGSAGGGVVYLPAGLYLVRLQTGKEWALRLSHNDVILRGAGREQTKLYCDDTNTRQKTILTLRPENPPWMFGGSNATPVSVDLLKPTQSIPVADASAYKPGDLISIRAEATPAFIESIGMTDKWKPLDKTVRGLTLFRRVTAVDRATNTLTIDVPTRYPMLKRDELKVFKVPDTLIRESAFEDFSVGMKENTTAGWGDGDYDVKGTGAYEVHASIAVGLLNAEDCWVRNVGSFHPAGNSDDIHVQSNGLRLAYCRQVTVVGCDFRAAQYRGGGGNGYLYCVNGSDNLLRDNLGVAGRHNFDLQMMSCTGNVLYHNTSRDGSLPSDFHMYLSTANLIDSMTFDGDFFESRYRPYGGPLHGESGSQNVFWNSIGLRYGKKQFIIESRQFGQGYVIGTQGAASAISPETTNFKELIGQSERLEPQSLWQDQLRRRLAKPADHN